MSYKVSENYTWKALKKAVVILNLKEGSYYTLNETASLIWKKLVDGISGDDIAGSLHEEFECDINEAREDVNNYIESCVAEGILEKQ